MFSPEYNSRRRIHAVAKMFARGTFAGTVEMGTGRGEIVRGIRER